MKSEITKLDEVPTTISEIKAALQELWNDVKLEDWRYLIHRPMCKMEDVIDCKGMAAVH